MASKHFRRNLAERWWTLFLWIVAGVFMVRFVVGFCLYVQPRLYESRMVLEEKLDPRAIRSMELELGAQLLQDVETRLDLEHRWNVSPEEAAELLRGALHVRRADSGDLTIIRCRHTSSQDARDIVEVVGELYAGWERAETIGLMDLETQMGIRDLERLRTQQEWNANAVEDWQEIREQDAATDLAMKVVDEGLDLEQAVQLLVEERSREPQPPSEVALIDRFLLDVPGEAEGVREPPAGELDREIASYRKLKASMEELPAEIQRLEGVIGRQHIPDWETAGIRVLEPPEEGWKPVSPRVDLWMAMTYLPGALLGAGLWWFYLAKWRDPERAAARRARKVRETTSVEY